MSLPSRWHRCRRRCYWHLSFLPSCRCPSESAQWGFVLFHIMKWIELKFLKANDHELFDQLTSGCPIDSSSHAVFVEKQAEQCLTQLTKYGLRTQHEAIEFLGSYYRSPLGCSELTSDYDVGMELLRDHIFNHLDALEPKFHLLIQMIHKLYAFVLPSLNSQGAWWHMLL